MIISFVLWALGCFLAFGFIESQFSIDKSDYVPVGVASTLWPVLIFLGLVLSLLRLVMYRE